MRLRAGVLCALLPAVPGAFAQVQLEGVRLGYALDEFAQTLRPMIGTPGSAYLGPSVPLPFPVRSGMFRAGVGLVVSSGTEARAYAVRGLEQGSPQTTDLGPSQRAYLDETGNFALLAGSGELRFVSGLQATPAVAPGVPFDTETLAAVTFLQGENCALIAPNESGNASLYRLCADRPAELTLVRSLSGTSVNAVAHTGQSGLYFTDRAANRVQLIRNPIESGAVEIMATSADGIEDPLGLAAIGSQEVLVALGGPAKAVVLSSRSTVAPAWIELPATPDRLEYLVLNRLLSCTGTGDQPLLVIDLLQDRTPFFIPVLRGVE